MQKWEYVFILVVFHFGTNTNMVYLINEAKPPQIIDIASYANYLGEQGWEYVDHLKIDVFAHRFQYIFRRQKIENEP